MVRPWPSIIVDGCAVVPQYRRGRGDYRVLWYVRVGCGSSGGNVEASFRHKKAHTVVWACSCRSRWLLSKRPHAMHSADARLVPVFVRAHHAGSCSSDASSTASIWAACCLSRRA